MRVAPAPRPAPNVAEPTPAAAPAASREPADDNQRALRAALSVIVERLDIVRHHAQAAPRRAQSAPFERAQQLELDRASRLAHAAVAVAGETPLARREVTAGDLTNRAMKDVAALRRFSGIRYETSVEDADYRIAIDPAAASQAIAGALDAFSDLVGASQDPDDDPIVRLKVHAVQPRPALMIEISATGIAVSDDALAAFFEPVPACHPAGAEAALLLNASARVARAHGGRADVRRNGDEVVALLVFPRSAHL